MIKETGGRKAVGHAFGHKSGQTGGSSPFHGRRPSLKQISMIDKEYIKEIISCITKKKADGNIVPATASMSEIMTAVREDALECMRTMCNEREIAVNRTLNSVSFKCL
nr:MAG TPA: hypothetical protein [Caudoviricetes sp.]